ncbi:YolD-like family protein [Planococcus sp. ISL-110]|uniref:YolD-like family protein n=1 Tax=Planococcus sp. ISL-110 TaxID=2819167 RepID=UPI001BE83971|nr:YolD-like family protein [Planococcus sp. ISL-110]MBT2571128.1 YolD-like family protein [Planococcus sp. ISL-110]
MKVNRHLKVQGDIKDRGVIKWQGMMLTEHVDLIRAWYEEDKHGVKPVLEEIDLQLLQEEMILASQRKCHVKIKTWKEKNFHYHVGIIQELNKRSRSIVYENPEGLHWLSMNELVGIWLID